MVPLGAVWFPPAAGLKHSVWPVAGSQSPLHLEVPWAPVTVHSNKPEQGTISAPLSVIFPLCSFLCVEINFSAVYPSRIYSIYIIF